MRGLHFFIICFVICYTSHSQSSISDFHKLAKTQFNSGNYADALKNHLKALTLAEKTNDCYEIAYGYLQVGIMHYYLKNKDVALTTFFEAEKYIDSCGIDTLKSFVYNNIGSIYTEEHKNDSALIYLNKTVSALKKTKRYADISKVYSIIAELYLNNFHNSVEAEKFIIQSEKNAELSGNTNAIVFASLKHAGYYETIKNYPEAIKYARKALLLEEQRGNVEGRIFAYKVLAECLILNKNVEALYYFNRTIKLSDSVFISETSNKIADYKTKYESEKKETENKLLQQQNKIDQAEISTKNKTIISLVVSVLLIIIIVFWRLTIINLKKKNRELDAAKAIQKEKERISRDLHDNVGGQLSYVLYSLDGINSVNTEKREELISGINDSVRSVISNLRETIWAINDESISINDFSDKFKVYMRSMFKNTDTKIIFNEQINQNIQLNSLVGLNLFRSCQEIINNAFKYSKANTIEITITANDKITIIVADNGVGFDIEKINKNGFGISNIKSRADEFGISLNLKTELNKGSVYTLIV